jgi:aryl-alcohol dehydrogenase-like predicted oxidoreductase
MNANARSCPDHDCVCLLSGWRRAGATILPAGQATNLDQLAELVKAPEIRLTPAEIAQIDAASG